MIPTFLLGVPGSVAGALVMVALMIQGVDAGPRFMSAGILPYVVFAGILCSQAAYTIGGLFILKWMVKIAYIPVPLLASSLAVLCFLGAFVERSASFDILLLVGFGILAYLLERMGYPTVCLILGIILGSLVETNLYRSMVMGGTNPWSIFITRPIAAVLLGIVILSLGIPFLVDFIKSRRPQLLSMAPDSEEIKEHKEDGSLPDMVFLIGLAVLWCIMLYMAQAYGPGARLFPVTLLIVGLVLVAVRMVGLIVTGTYRKGSLHIPKEMFFPANGRIPWPLGVLLLIGVILLTYVIGFVPASAIFMVVVLLFMQYKPLKVGLAVVAGTMLVVVVMASVFRLYLPMGWLGDLASRLFS